MYVFGRVLHIVTSLTLVSLNVEPSLGMTLSEDQRATSTMMAPADDQLEHTSQLSVAKRYTESREVQEHINRLFTYAVDTPRPSRPTGRSNQPPPPSLEVPKCATEHAYCTDGEEGLPDDISEEVDQLLGSSPELSSQYNATDILTPEDKAIIQRGSDDPDENHLCGFKVELSRITWATSEDNVVMRIAQGKNFAQAVRLEHCTDQNCGCHAMFTSGLPGRYVARCKQKYVYRQLLALTEDARQMKVAPHRFALPSCCSCVITKQLDIRDGDKKCKKDDHGQLGERISPDDNDTAPPEDENMDQPFGNMASQTDRLPYVMWTTIFITFRFIDSHVYT